METVVVFNCSHTKSMPTMCAGKGVLISQYLTPVTISHDPSLAQICAIDSSATHIDHNIG